MRRTTKKMGYTPDYAVPPGHTLLETLQALGMEQRELATRTGLSEKHISKIINAEVSISYDTADKLELATGVPARMWNNLEMKYREHLTRLRAMDQAARDTAWLKRVPVKELVKRGMIPPGLDPISQMRATLGFFGVSSVEAWNNLWMQPQAAFRRSATFDMHPEAMATWLRLGELKAQKIPCQPYDRAKFLAALAAVRKLTTAAPEVFKGRVVELCATAGVAVVFVAEISHCPASGVARWLSPTKALIQLSLRHKSDDHLWFSFFHEAGHILTAGKKKVSIDDSKPESEEDERRANQFAADFLIPPARAKELPALKTPPAVRQFAARLGIAPGIVVGRLQHEKLIKVRYMNELKRPFAWNN